MTIDTTKLRELAQNATPGPWEWCGWDNDSFEIVSGGFDSEGRVIGSTVVQPDASDEEGYGGVKRREDADYISAANPATVLALLDKLDGTERMFLAACADLGAINKLLGLDPDDGGAKPIVYEAIRLLAIEAAARKLVKVKGRHNSEIAYQRLVEVLG